MSNIDIKEYIILIKAKVDSYTGYFSRSGAVIAVALLGVGISTYFLYSTTGPKGAASEDKEMEKGMMGGFTPVTGVENGGVIGALKAIENRAKAIAENRPVKVDLLKAEKQVVAGMNYKLVVHVEDSHLGSTYYSCVVWEKLPAYGGGFEVTKMDSISAKEAGVVEQESIDDPDADLAASYALEQLSQQSNSLFPFQLKKLVFAEKSKNDEDNVVHHMILRVAQGDMAEQTVDIVVENKADHGFVLSNSVFM